MEGRLLRFSSVVVALLALMSAVPTQAQDEPSLPGGASSLQETFGDWQVACQIVEATRRCALSQQQVQQTGQRVLAIELVPGPGRAATGTLLLPFGLALEAGVDLQLDDQQTMDSRPFRTCLPVGCIVPFELDEGRINAMRAGATLGVIAKSSDTEQDIGFGISLTGFSAAMDRITALSEDQGF